MSHFGAHLKIQYQISHKLEKVNALSSPNAVSMELAGFSVQEQGWIPCLLNVKGLLGTIKRSGDRYYLTPS